MREILYKYCPLNIYTVSNLLLSQIHFSPVDRLNDQLEGLIKIKNPDFKPSDKARKNFLVNNMIKSFELNDDKFVTKVEHHFYNQLLSSYEVCCFSTIGKEPVMWSHYADSLKGICLAYDKDLLLESLAELGLGISFYDVKYGKKPEMTIRERGEKIVYDFDIDFLATKSRHWKYEKEVRIVKKKDLIHSTSNGATIQVPRCALVGVILGSQIEWQFQEIIDDILENEKHYEHVYLAQVSVNYKSGKITYPYLRGNDNDFGNRDLWFNYEN